MKHGNKLNAIASMIALAALSLGCGSLMSGSKQAGGANNATNAAPQPVNSATNSTANTATTSAKVEKADFTVTSEELDKEFHKEGVTSEDLEKYENKNIAVTGRVSTLVMEKKGTVQPWVTLYAPGVLRGVSCYFDDEDVDQMKRLKEDKMAKVQGFMDDFIVPKISPRLEHCQVIEPAS
ncbi:MAG: hypothetical protein PSX80_16285 [bacterium]|nr:hypothetical protein [bacterium]